MDDDWILVPRVPTEEMIFAGFNAAADSGKLTTKAEWFDLVASVFRAMLAAAPAFHGERDERD